MKTEYLQVFDSFRNAKEQITQAFTAIQTGNPQGKVTNGQKREQYSKENCPACGNAKMKVVKTKKNTRFLACEDFTCKSTLALPKIGRLTFLKTKCCACGFSPIKIMKILKNKKKFDYYLCPNCWTKELVPRRKLASDFVKNAL